MSRHIGAAHWMVMGCWAGRQPTWSVGAPLSTTKEVATMRRYTKKKRGGAPHKESQPTLEITPPQTSAFHLRN